MTSTAAPQNQPLVIGEKKSKKFWELLAGGFCDPKNESQDWDDDEPMAGETTVPVNESKLLQEESVASRGMLLVFCNLLMFKSDWFLPDASQQTLLGNVVSSEQLTTSSPGCQRNHFRTFYTFYGRCKAE